ncbi:hypothetical protein [Rubrobacter aplysinae]|uniref:hypothetical protein n=1 Tax=Rubrobacter aplysinae TaxID=909625 RepID=UPI00064BD454|nr:hypothetical protein [Rubrobacter aplysinae]
MAVALVALALVISSCGSSDNGGEQGQTSGSGGSGGETGPAPAESAGTTSMDGTTGGMESTSMGGTTGGMETTGAGTTSMGTTSMGETTAPTLAGQPQDEIRDGTWRVDGAGTVRFSFTDGTDGGVELEDVSPRSGWDQRVAEQSADELEVHFTRGDADWKFEVEVDGGQAEISTERDTRPADAGSYRVGDAAEVEFSSEGETLSLDNVDTKDGWRVSSRDESSDDIELDFEKGGGLTAEFEAEQSNGQTKLETSQKVSGPVPN